MPSLRLVQFHPQHHAGQVGPVSLTIPAGSCACLCGPSGCGKSVLLRAIADLDPHQGGLFVDDTPYDTLPAPTWRQRVRLVMAESQWWAARVADHFKHPLAAQALASLGLPADALTWEVARCSTGERQRLALLRALADRPGVLLLDEPTGNLDADNTARVEALVADYRVREHAAVLWVSHDEGQVARVAERVFHLADGALQERAIGACQP